MCWEGRAGAPRSQMEVRRSTVVLSPGTSWRDRHTAQRGARDTDTGLLLGPLHLLYLPCLGSWLSPRNTPSRESTVSINRTWLPTAFISISLLFWDCPAQENSLFITGTSRKAYRLLNGKQQLFVIDSLNSSAQNPSLAILTGPGLLYHNSYPVLIRDPPGLF